MKKIALLLLALAVMAVPAWGTDIPAGATATEINDAISAAVDGSTLNFAAGTTYYLNIAITVGKNVTLNGNGATLTAADSSNITIINITAGSPTINGFVITKGNATGDGGGMNITTTGTGTVTVTNCVFDNNEAQGNKGGGVYLSQPVHPRR